MNIHKVSSLDSSLTRQIQTLVTACTNADGTSVSFPFQDADLFLFSEDAGRMVSAIAFVPMEDLLYECSAFTDPEFRGHGLFSELLDEGLQALPEDSELLFYTDKKNTVTTTVLEAMGAELNSEEHMMELLPENFSAKAAAEITREILDLDGTETLRFHSSHAVVNFSVFPSHHYLYSFEVTESCRGMGYGTAFLHAVLTELFGDSTFAPRPVLLEVSGDNAAALSLYKKTGFRITETLCCYLY